MTIPRLSIRIALRSHFEPSRFMSDWDKIIQALGPNTSLAMFLTVIGALLWFVQQIVSIVKGWIDIRGQLPSFALKSEAEKKAIRRDRSPVYMIAAVIGYRIIITRIEHTSFSGDAGVQAIVGEITLGFVNCVLCTVINAILNSWNYPIGVFFISSYSLLLVFALLHHS